MGGTGSGLFCGLNGARRRCSSREPERVRCIPAWPWAQDIGLVVSKTSKIGKKTPVWAGAFAGSCVCSAARTPGASAEPRGRRRWPRAHGSGTQLLMVPQTSAAPLGTLEMSLAQPHVLSTGPRQDDPRPTTHRALPSPRSQLPPCVGARGCPETTSWGS